ADSIVERIGDVEVIGRIDRDALRGVEHGENGGAIIAAVSLASVAGDGADGAAGSHFPDDVIAEIGDVQIAGGIDGEADGSVQLRVGGGAAVARVSDAAAAGDCRDGAAGDFAHAGGQRVGDVDVAGAIDGETFRGIQLGAGGRAVIAAEARRAVAGEIGDGPVGGDFADDVVIGVGDVEVACRIHGDGLRAVQLRFRGRAAIT